MEEGGFDKQRRNVLVISTVIVAFNLAGGDLSQLTFQGMQLKNGSAAITLVWIAFVYVLWRYWLYSKNELHEFVRQFWEFAVKDPQVTEQAEFTFESDMRVLQKEMLATLNANTSLRENNPQEPTREIVYIGASMFAPTFTLRLTKGSWHIGQSPYRQLRTDFALSTILRLTLPFAAANRSFSDVILPYLIALVAVGVATIRYVLL